MNEDQMLGLIKDEGSACAEALEEALDALAEVIQQACWLDSQKELDSMALSAYAEGIQVLADHGKVEIIDQAGRRVIAKWVRDE